MGSHLVLTIVDRSLEEGVFLDHPTFSELKRLLSAGGEHLAALLDEFSLQDREEFTRAARVAHAVAGEVLIGEGTESAEIGYVIEGALGMVKTLPDGRVHIIGILVPTDMYGRLFDGPSSYQIKALTEATLVSFERTSLETILSRNPALERMFLVSILDELDAAREWILLLNGTSVIERVASFLLILARRELKLQTTETNRPVEVRFPVRRRDLAKYLGVRPETLSRAIHRLSRDGIIAIHENDRFEIRDKAGLLENSGKDLVLSERTPRQSLHRR